MALEREVHRANEKKFAGGLIRKKLGFRGDDGGQSIVRH